MKTFLLVMFVLFLLCTCSGCAVKPITPELDPIRVQRVILSLDQRIKILEANLKK